MSISVLFLYSIQIMNLKLSLLEFESSKPLKSENEGNVNVTQNEVDSLKVYWIVVISKDFNSSIYSRWSCKHNKNFLEKWKDHILHLLQTRTH